MRKTSADLAMERIVAEDAKVYRMDVATRAHLTAYCEWAFRAEEAEGRRDEIVSHLEAMMPEDAAYWLDKGWRVVADLMEDAREVRRASGKEA